MEELISRIVDRIIEDIADRQGLGDAWSQTDLEIQQNIRTEWASIVRDELAFNVVHVEDLP